MLKKLKIANQITKFLLFKLFDEDELKKEYIQIIFKNLDKILTLYIFSLLIFIDTAIQQEIHLISNFTVYFNCATIISCGILIVLFCGKGILNDLQYNLINRK